MTSLAFVMQVDKEKKFKPILEGSKDKPLLEDRGNKVYSFKCEKVKKIFNDVVKSGL